MVDGNKHQEKLFLLVDSIVEQNENHHQRSLFSSRFLFFLGVVVAPTIPPNRKQRYGTISVRLLESLAIATRGGR